MSIKIQASKQINATITLPSSKSISNRVLLIHALAKGKCPLRNLSECDDTQVLIHALQSDSLTLDIQAAGTAMRFLTAYLAITPGTKVLTGTERMQQRPIRVLVDALRSLGAQINYLGEEGFPPLKITGNKLHRSEIELPGNISSQYISALLMIAPMLPQGLHIKLTSEIISRPYIDLTLQLMTQFGAKASWTGASELRVEPKPYQEVDFEVESDWSAASYWYEMIALTSDGQVTLPHLFEQSIQGDRRVAQLFESLGVKTTYQKDAVTLSRMERTTKQLEIDFVNQPDLAQTFVVTCCLLHLPFHFTGLQSLKIKETDRLLALTQELLKLGYVLHQEDDSILWWNGERCTPADQAIDTYQDHRMAMAFAPACLVLGDIEINHPEVVSKSYPSFWKDLEAAGFTMNKQ